IELHSSDAKHTIVMRHNDTASAQSWFTLMQTTITNLTSKVICELREHASRHGIAGSREIRHLGWLAEK
ncbi:hypothetical protein M9458_032801, partial [Cirrhinus mrigala]